MAMDKFSLIDFKNDYEFEDYLMSKFKWQNWSLLQSHIITMPHKTIGLYDSERMEMVAVCVISEIDNDLIYIHLFQTRDDLEGHGYGSTLFKILKNKYLRSHSGFKLQYTNKSLGFWLKQGFEFDDNDIFLIM